MLKPIKRKTFFKALFKKATKSLDKNILIKYLMITKRWIEILLMKIKL